MAPRVRIEQGATIMPAVWNEPLAMLAPMASIGWTTAALRRRVAAAWGYAGAVIGLSLASFLRSWAVAASRNSSRARLDRAIGADRARRGPIFVAASATKQLLELHPDVRGFHRRPAPMLPSSLTS